jgi:hypothetical protein
MPAEVLTGGWPATVNSGVVLSSPVHENGSDNTFVRDAAGFLYRVDSSGVATASGQLDFGTTPAEGPILDASIGAVYVFASDDILGFAGVYQLSTAFGAGTKGTEVPIGAGSVPVPPVPLYNGGFDHNYLTSKDSTGSMYVCGDPGARPTLYQVQIEAGVITGSLPGPIVSLTNPAPCSPVTVVYNPNVTGAGLPQE